MPISVFSRLSRALAVGALSLHEKDSRQLIESQLKHVCRQLPLIQTKRPELAIPFLHLLQVMLVSWSPAVLDICADIQLIPWLIHCVLESLDMVEGSSSVFETYCISEKGHLAAVCLGLYVIARQRCGTIEESSTATAALLIMILQETPLIPYIYRYFVRISTHKNGKLFQSPVILRSIGLLWQLWAVFASAIQRSVSIVSQLDKALIQALLDVGVEKLIMKLFQAMTVICSFDSCTSTDNSAEGSCNDRLNNLLLLVRICRLTLSSLMHSDPCYKISGNTTPQEVTPHTICMCHFNENETDHRKICKVQATHQLMRDQSYVCGAEIWLLRVHESAMDGIQGWIMEQCYENSESTSWHGTIPLFQNSANDSRDDVLHFFNDLSRRRESLRMGHCLAPSEYVVDRVQVGSPPWCRHLRTDIAFGGLIQICLNHVLTVGGDNVNDLLSEIFTLARCFCASSGVVAPPYVSPVALFNHQYLSDLIKSWISSATLTKAIKDSVLRLYKTNVVIVSVNNNATEVIVPSGELLAHWTRFIGELICYVKPTSHVEEGGITAQNDIGFCPDWVDVLEVMMTQLTCGDLLGHNAWLRATTYNVTYHLLQLYSRLLTFFIHHGEDDDHIEDRKFTVLPLFMQMASVIKALSSQYHPASVFLELKKMLDVANSISNVVEDSDKTTFLNMLRANTLNWVYDMLLGYSGTDSNYIPDSSISFREYFCSPAWASLALNCGVDRRVSINTDIILSDDGPVCIQNASAVEEGCKYWRDCDGITISVWFAVVGSSWSGRTGHIHNILFSLSGVAAPGSAACDRPDIEVVLCEGRICMMVGRYLNESKSTVCSFSSRTEEQNEERGHFSCVVFSDLPLVVPTCIGCVPSYQHVVVRYSFSTGKAVAYLNGSVSSEQWCICEPSALNEDVENLRPGKYTIAVASEVVDTISSHIIDHDENGCDVFTPKNNHELLMGSLLLFQTLLTSSEVTLLHAAGPRYADVFTNTPTSEFSNVNASEAGNISIGDEQHQPCELSQQHTELHVDARFCSSLLIDQILYPKDRRSNHYSGVGSNPSQILSSLSPSKLLVGITSRHLSGQRLPSDILAACWSAYSFEVSPGSNATFQPPEISELYSGLVVQQVVDLNSSTFFRLAEHRTKDVDRVDKCFAVVSTDKTIARSNGFLFDYCELSDNYVGSRSDYHCVKKVIFYPANVEQSVENLLTRQDSWLDICSTLLRALFFANKPKECQQVLRLIRCLWQLRGIDRGSQSFMYALIELLRAKIMVHRCPEPDVSSKELLLRGEELCNSKEVLCELGILACLVLKNLRPAFRERQDIVSTTFSVPLKHECVIRDIALFRLLIRDFLLSPAISNESFSRMIQCILDVYFDPASKLTAVNKKLCEQSSIFQLLLKAACSNLASRDKLLIYFGTFFHTLVMRDMLSRKDYFFLFHFACVLSTASTSFCRSLNHATMVDGVYQYPVDITGSPNDTLSDSFHVTRNHCRFLRQCILSLIQYVSI